MDFNNVESPFSFDLGDELLPLPSLSCIDNTFVPQLPLENSKTVSRNLKNGRRKKPPPSTSDDKGDGDGSSNEHKKKKIMHRDVERQRRQEMSSLYSTLRSLLPIEYLKGKRSICDHMQETVKYIRYMQSKIQELSDKREELKILSNNQNSDMVEMETLNSSKRDKVLVRAKNGSGGIQVVLDTATQYRLPLSNILEALIEQGLEILSCNSNKINDRFLHTIESEPVFTSAQCPTIDISDLQYKLTNLEYFPLD